MAMSLGILVDDVFTPVFERVNICGFLYIWWLVVFKLPDEFCFVSPKVFGRPL